MENEPKKKSLDTLFEAVNLREVFSEATEYREPAKAVVDQVAEKVIDKVVETAGPIAEKIAPIVEAVPVIPEKPYDAEKNAQSLVYGMQAIEQIILNPIALGKQHMKIGGKKTKQKMKAAYIKKMNGETLNKTEENLVIALEDYERKMTLLSDSILPNPKKTEFLIRAAIPYCEESKMEVKAGLAFWGAYSGDLVEKITLILMT